MRRIFSDQARGNIPDAVRASSQLTDTLLMGHVLADRYLGRFHRSTVAELTDWLARYGDEPDAPAIRSLLMQRLPKGTATPPDPAYQPLPVLTETITKSDDIDPSRTDIQRNPILDQAVHDRALNGQSGAALRLIAARRGLSPAYAAQLRAEVARILFTQNQDREALRVARTALDMTPAAQRPALAAYVGGLAAWRLGRLADALALFEDGARAPTASPRLLAASALWASRALNAVSDDADTAHWLRLAARQRQTLYGMLARHILGLDTDLIASGQLLSQADVAAVAATPAGWRAFALMQVGQNDRAEAELSGLWAGAAGNPVFARSLIMVTSAAGFPGTAARMTELARAADGHPRAALRFPVPSLRPAGGFSVDPPLVYALTRIESNFDPTAVSPAGARGLMQIMPATAAYLTGAASGAARQLHEPASNLAIGQRYIRYLARQDGIDHDLIRMLASYNAGPGSFARWSTSIRDNGDPLLFLEAIPVPETRHFVRHALLLSWIYAAQLGMPAPSLDELADGEFPRFTPGRQGRKMAMWTPVIH